MLEYNRQRDKNRQEAGEAAVEDIDTRIARKVKGYVWDDNPAVRKHLEWFLDQKLGLMVHYGIYNELGIKESWPLIDHSTYGNNPKWTRWQFPEGWDGQRVKKEYFKLHKGFNPRFFDPEQWADFAWQTGFKYLLFTAKHHDGFCMWDTKTTPFRVTGPECPFHDHPNADMVRRLYDAFRAKGMGISVYFSKLDWGSELYWEPGFLDRTDISDGFPSYRAADKPDLWERFVQYSHAQIRELCQQSGPVDCLWLDGGVVGKRNGLDLRVDEIVDELRRTNPGLLCADRSQGGKYENFLTPELEIPETVLPVPWETCLCLGKRLEGESYTSFGYTFDQDYYTSTEALHIFLEIVARGGNLALNIAPQPDGRLPLRAVRTLKDFGRWMHIHGRGIYGTRPCEPYFRDNYRYMKKGDSIFVYRLYTDAERAPREMTFDAPFEVRAVTYMRTGQRLEFERKGNRIRVEMPLGIVGLTGLMADGFEIE